MLVPRSAHAEAVAIAAAAAATVVVGDPADAGDRRSGPSSAKLQWRKIQGLIETGIEEGAKLVAGGPGRPEGLDARLLRAARRSSATSRNDMTIAREEIFGPVLCILPYENEEEAIRIANDTPYGLSAYVVRRQPEHAPRGRLAPPHRQRAPERRRASTSARRSAATSSRATAASGASSASRSSSR